MDGLEPRELGKGMPICPCECGHIKVCKGSIRKVLSFFTFVTLKHDDCICRVAIFVEMGQAIPAMEVECVRPTQHISDDVLFFR